MNQGSNPRLDQFSTELLEATKEHATEMLGLTGKELPPTIARVERIVRDQLAPVYIQRIMETLDEEEIEMLMDLVYKLGTRRIIDLITSVREESYRVMRANFQLGEAVKLGLFVAPRIFRARMKGRR